MAAIDLHRALRPGLLESAYEGCLLYGTYTRDMKYFPVEGVYIKKILNRFLVRPAYD